MASKRSLNYSSTNLKDNNAGGIALGGPGISTGDQTLL